jgi:hypothetical protein
VKCSNFTVRNAAFTAKSGQDNAGIWLSGAGKILDVSRTLFDNVVFEGYSRGVKVMTMFASRVQ